MYRAYIIFGFLVCVARAQIPSFGFCPDYLPMAHFDMERFLGKWYEAERYFQFSEVASRCVVTDYAVGPNGKIYISNEVTNRFTGVRRVIGGNLDLTGKKTDGKLVIKYDTTPLSTTSALSILDTDYDTYAVIWSCNGLGPVNAQSAWLMTRERIPDTTTLQKAYGVLDRYKISRTFFVKTDQAGCAIAASDLNAALGIASTSTNVDQNADNNIENEKMNIRSALPIADLILKRGEEAETVAAKVEAAEEVKQEEVKANESAIAPETPLPKEEKAPAVALINAAVGEPVGEPVEEPKVTLIDNIEVKHIIPQTEVLPENNIIKSDIIPIETVPEVILDKIVTEDSKIVVPQTQTVVNVEPSSSNNLILVS